MSSFSPQRSQHPGSGDALNATKSEMLRSELESESDPARRARLLHALGRIADVVERNDVNAANEYLAAFQTHRPHRMALIDLIGIYERRKSPANLAKLYQVEAKTAPTPEEKASALLDLASVRADLANDEAGGASALGEALAAAPDLPDVSLVGEMAARLASDTGALEPRLRSRLASCDDPVLGAELATALADLLVAAGRRDEASTLLAERDATGAPAIRLALAAERIARRSGDSDARATALERLGDLAASALDDAAAFEEPGVGPLLWEDAIAARALAIAAYREAAAVRTGRGEDDRVVALYDKAIEVEPNAPWTRLERLATARRLGRDEVVAADEEALAEAIPSGPLAAFVLQRLAARLDRIGRPEDAEAARAEARSHAPSSAVLAAASESGLRNAAQARRWSESLGADAPNTPLGRLVEAAFVHDELLGDYATAHNLYERAIEMAQDPAPLLRGLYASALARGDAATAAAALARMGTDGSSADADRRVERGVLTAVHSDDPGPAAAVVAPLLDATADGDTAEFVRGVGALADDYGLVERAHLHLAQIAKDEDDRAAHRCAAARAAIADGRTEDAERSLEAALDAVEGHALAVSMLDALLRARNDHAGLAALGRRAAMGRAGEAAPLVERIRAIVESAVAGRAADAVRGTNELLDAHPENRTVARLASFVANRTADGALARRSDRSTATIERGALAAFAALRVAERAFAAKPPEFEEAARMLAIALESPETELEAAVGYALLPDGLRDGELAQRARAAIANVSPDEADRFFAHPAKAASPEGTDAFVRATNAPSDDVATAQLELALESQAGPGAGLVALVARTLDSEQGRDLRDDLGLLVLRAANTPGAGRLASMLAEVSFGPDDDATVPLAALEAAAREASTADRVAVRARLGRALHEAGRARDAVTVLAEVVEESDDLASLEALRFAARDAGDHERFVVACDRLATVASGATRAELLEDAAAVLADRLRRPTDALERARAALAAAPDRDRAYQRVRALLTELRDERGLAELLASRASQSTDVTTRVKQRFEAARLRRSAGDREGALAEIAALLADDPGHAGALALRAELAVSVEDWEGAVGALRALADADVPVAQKRVARLGAADFLERKLGRAAEALAELRLVDALGFGDAALLQRMARIAESEDRFDDALALHERVVRSDASPLRRAESERIAARLHLTVRRDADAAAAGFRRALELVPDDVDSAASLMRIVTDDAQKLEIARGVDAAVRATLVPESLRIETLRKLLRIADLRGTRDLMKLVLSTLTVLRVATEDERSREEENTAIVRRVRPPAHPIAEALDRVRTPLDRGPYADIAAALFEVFVELDDLSLTRLGAKSGEPMPRTDGVRQELVDLATAFGLAESEAYLSPQLDARRVVGVPTERGVHFVVPRHAAMPLDPDLRFQAGRVAWGIAHRTLPFVQRTPEEGASILLAALEACDVPIGDAKQRPGVAEWTKSISRAISRKSKKAIHDLGVALPDRGLGAEAFCRATRQSSLRAGLLVSSDLDAALSAVLGSAASFERVAAHPEAADLVCFHLSSTSLTLRRELGLAS